ncbi:DNA helicase [Tanacetum coccineum]|uniref:ATP-dependent DNA helicase n=1 Tax=Tanacetum coccineum TaxID=301880 RepID=A0ABQ5HY97_9ASTR
MKGESRLYNCNVVPYNRMLCLAFCAHINVEYCGWSMLIKYLFKYILKGPDRILRKIDRHVGNTSSSTVEKHIHVDEIKNYVDGRFVCSFEACWRIFDCPIHHREPAAQILNVHLENMQRVNFREKDRLNVIVNMPDKKKTTLIEWYVYNNQHTDGRHLTYLDFPFEFVWYADSKSWHKRMIRTKKSIGRLTYVRPNSSYLFYFKKLLSHQKGCKSPVEVRTINGQVLPTYQAACGALGLLEDDKEWDIAVEESGKVSEATGILNYHLNTPELQGYTLYELEAILNGFGMSVKEFGLPTPLKHLLKDLKNKLLMEEKNYRLDVLLQESALSVPKLNEEQKQIYNLIMNASEQSQHEMLFIYAVASSGIASLLLPAGRTSHSRFKLPLKLTDESVCHAKKHSQLGNLLVETNLIIWDEALMIVKRCFEALLRSDLSDEQRERSKLFAEWLLDVGNGEIGYPDKDNDFIYNDATLKAATANAFQEKAIVCLKNDVANAVNAKILSLVKGVAKTYLTKGGIANYAASNCEPVRRLMQRYKNDRHIPNVKAVEAQIITGTRVGEKSFTAIAGTNITSLRVGKEDCVIEAKVYQKWTSKNYLGCIRSISDITPSRDANTGQNGNVVEFTMFDDLANQFNKQEIEKLPHPIIIVVSSCCVSKYKEKQHMPTQCLKKNTIRIHLSKSSTIVTKTQNKRRHEIDKRYIPCSNKIRQASRYNFKATIADGTTTVEFTCFTEAGQKITRRSCSDVMQKFEATDKTQLPVELVNTIGKNHIFQIQFSPNTPKGAGQFIVNDVLDIQPAGEQENLGLMTHASTSKEKGADTKLATSTVLTSQDSTSKDSSMPGFDTRNSC